MKIPESRINTCLLYTSMWKDTCGIADRNLFILRADHFVKGILLENIILAETYKTFQKIDLDRYYVSQLSITLRNNNQHVEADMILVDKQKGESYLFEVKYSNQKMCIRDSCTAGCLQRNGLLSPAVFPVLPFCTSGNSQISPSRYPKRICQSAAPVTLLSYRDLLYLSLIHIYGCQRSSGRLHPRKAEPAENKDQMCIRDRTYSL